MEHTIDSLYALVQRIETSTMERLSRLETDFREHRKETKAGFFKSYQKITVI